MISMRCRHASGDFSLGLAYPIPLPAHYIDTDDDDHNAHHDDDNLHCTSGARII